MHEVTVSVVILVLLVLIGIVAYYIYDYYNQKAKVDSEIKSTNKRVDVEKSERLGNVKSIVDQVNVAHDSMNDEFTKVEGDIDGMNKGIQRVMSFSDVGPDGTPKAIGLKDLPSATNPDLGLLTHVTSVGGLTIKDLDSTAGSSQKMRVCAKEDPTKCIKIPDENGNVYLTNLYKDSAIALDGSTIINAPLSFTEAGKLGARISGNNDGTGFMETGAFGIGTTKFKPNASLHIMSDPAMNVSPFKVSVNGMDVLDVDRKGTLHTSRIELRPPGTTTTTAVLTAVEDGIMLDAPNVYTSGNLLVNGVVYQSAAGAAETTRLLEMTTPKLLTGPTSGPITTMPVPPPPEETPASGIATFTSGPIKMGGFMTPSDFMNQPYLITVQ